MLPPSEPEPLGERLMPVAPLTFAKLPLASGERTVTLKVAPTAAVAGTTVTASFEAAPGLTVNELLVPVSAPPLVRVAVIVKLPVLEIVTGCELSTPAVNAAVVPTAGGERPVEVMSTVPVKPVTVLPFASRAVIRTLKRAACGLRADRPPPAASTRKSFSAPGLTVNELLVPFCAPPLVRVAVIVKLPVFEIVTACERGRRW